MDDDGIAKADYLLAVDRDEQAGQQGCGGEEEEQAFCNPWGEHEEGGVSGPLGFSGV